MNAVEKHLKENKDIIFEEYRKAGIEPDENGILNIEVMYDGTWHTRSVNTYKIIIIIIIIVIIIIIIIVIIIIFITIIFIANIIFIINVIAISIILFSS